MLKRIAVAITVVALLSSFGIPAYGWHNTTYSSYGCNNCGYYYRTWDYGCYYYIVYYDAKWRYCNYRIVYK